MASNSRTAEVLLKYSVDSASANRVRQSFASLDSELEQLRSDLLDVGSSAQLGVSNLRQRFAAGESAVESMQADVETLRRELLSLDDVRVTPVVDVQSADGGGIKNNSTLNTIDRFGRFGTQIAGGVGNSGFGNLVGLAGDVADSFSTLGVAGGAAALAVGGLSLVLNDMKQRAEEAAAAQRRLIEGERAGEAQAVDTVQARIARIAEIIDLVKAEEASITERRQEILVLQEQYRNAVGLNGNLLDQFRAGSDLEGQIRELEQSITNSENAVAGLSAEFVELNAQLNSTKDGAGAFADKLSIVLDTFSKIGKEVSKFQGIQGGIADGMTPFQDSQAELNAALQTTKTDAYLGAITKTVEAQQALTAAQNAYNEAVAASQQRISDITSRMNDDLTAAESERLSELADAEQKASDDRKQIVRDTAKELARIEKRAALSKESAVAERDALAAKRAEQQRDQEIEQLQDRYTDQKEAVDKSLAAQQKTIQSRYEAQVKTVRAAADAAIRLETQRAQAELSVRQQALQAAQTQMINAANAELMIRSNLYNQSVSQATVWANTMQMILSYGLSIPGGTGTPKMPTPIIGKWAGGNVYPGQTYVVGEKGPEIFQTAVPGRIIPNGAGTNINLNVSGATTETIKVVSRQQAISTFNRILDSIGVA